jgi:hypothetical protein
MTEKHFTTAISIDLTACIEGLVYDLVHGSFDTKSVGSYIKCVESLIPAHHYSWLNP